MAWLTRAKQSPAVKIARATFTDFFEDKCPRLSAALAYYTAFSLVPFLVLAIFLLGLMIGQAAAEERIVASFAEIMGPDGTGTLADMVRATSVQGHDAATAWFGVGALLLGAAGVFGQLHDALNTVWEVQVRKGRGIAGWLRDRFLSFGMVFGLAFLLIASLLLSAGVAGLVRVLAGRGFVADAFLMAAEIALTLPVLTLVLLLLFKHVPDVKIRWADATWGAAFTAGLLVLGKFVVGFYLGRTTTASRYGPAAAIVLLLLWVYYVGLIVMLGAEFTQAYAHERGAGIQPNELARVMPEAQRRKEGLGRAKGSGHRRGRPSTRSA